MITAGIDCGAKNTKTVIFQNGKLIGTGCVPTGFDQKNAVNASFNIALKDAGVEQNRVDSIGATGSGAKSIQADIYINDIKAIAAAANHFFPNARTVADIGAEEARAAKISDKGEALDFAINEKCAAGSGAFLEAMSRALETPLEQLGLLALSSSNSISINAQCTIFAESEVVGLIHAKKEKQDISKAIHDAIAGRIASMIRRIGVNPELVVLGGVARNPGFIAALKRELETETILIPDLPEYAAAIGAAVLAARDRR